MIVACLSRARLVTDDAVELFPLLAVFAPPDFRSAHATVFDVSLERILAWKASSALFASKSLGF